jgi:hypothetical protein
MNRLNEERKQWRRDHPFGFYAKPQRNAQGLLDLKTWECGIPGKEKTLWEGGLFKLSVIFPDGQYIYIFFCHDALRRVMMLISLQSIRPNHPSVWILLLLRRPTADMSRQIRPSALSPQRLPLRYRLPLHLERGRRVEAGDHHQANPSWSSRPPR